MITALTLTDFRSYAAATLPIAAGAVVLHGPNGAGKTNLLEALSLFTPGKGLRGATAPEMGRREPGEATGRAWAVAAILTVGMALIGIGHLHSSTEVLGVVGAARTNGAKGAPDINAPSLWLPVHKWTGDTYAWLSEGSMSPSFSTTTLASLHPNLGEQALGLARDTFDKRGRIARTYAGPNSIRIDKAILVSDYSPPRGAPMRAYVVDVHLDPEATTEGQGFAISASQLRLIGPSAGTKTTVAYPIGWSQPNTGGGRTFYRLRAHGFAGEVLAVLSIATAFHPTTTGE